MSKTNIEYLRSIIDELAKSPIEEFNMGTDFKDEKIKEAYEFLDAVESESKEKADEIATLKKEIDALQSSEDEESDDPEESYDFNDFEWKDLAGMGAVGYAFSGNTGLNIQMEVEDFFEKLHAKYALPTPKEKLIHI